MWVPGYRPNRRMDMVQRRSHHSPRSWISVSYCTTTVCGHTCSWTTCGRQQCHCPVASNHCPKECEAHSTHTLFSPIIVDGRSRGIVRTDPIPKPGVSSTLPSLRKGKCCRRRVEPGVLPTFGVDGRTRESSPHTYI